MGDSAKSKPRRIAKVLLTVAITAGAVASLSSMGLISCSAPTPPPPSRPLNSTEVQRLAGMRADNHREGRVGLHGMIGPIGEQTRVGGWIDWRRSLLYVALTGPGAEAPVLLQATPTVLALREEVPAGEPAGQSPGPESAPTPSATPSSADPAGDSFDPPPTLPPADGWRVRPVSVGAPGSTPLDSLVQFLFLLARPAAEDAALLTPLRNQWIRSDTVRGTTVDVLFGPALPLSTPAPAASSAAPSGPPVTPGTTAAAGTGGGGGISATASAPAPAGTATSAQPDPAKPSGTIAGSVAPSQSPAALDPSSLDAHGGGVGYWLDTRGRLHRVEAMLAAGQPVVLDLLRAERAEFRTIDALGGRAISPRPVTDREATLLAKTRVQNLAAKGGQLTLTLPVRPAGLRQASGWLDWRNGRAYLSVRDPHTPANDRLIFADRTGIASHRVEGPAPQSPPTSPPKGDWTRTAWSAVNATVAGADLDLMLAEVLSLTASRPDDVKAVGTMARWLRVDLLHGVPVGVFELPSPAEQRVTPPGLARLRYWIDNGGVLRRLEVRTGTGGLAQLDIDPALQPTTPLPASVR